MKIILPRPADPIQGQQGDLDHHGTTTDQHSSAISRLPRTGRDPGPVLADLAKGKGILAKNKRRKAKGLLTK
jgi:hypothetical protein